jgi:hypothetical protein
MALKDFSGAAIVGILSFSLYVGTLPPTVVGGDSGEIVVSAWKLALPHPPGISITYFLHFHLGFRALSSSSHVLAVCIAG